jgi:hypothetical protein
MMKRCREEIQCLRHQIAQLEPKADAYDNLVIVLRLLPRPLVGVGEDLVYTLDKRIREVSDMMKPAPPAGANS